MQSFLKDAENKLDSSHLIREWVSDVRDLAYDCEDVIDTYLLKLVVPKSQVGFFGGAFLAAASHMHQSFRALIS